MQDFLQHPFVIGLLVGLALCALVWTRGWLDRRALQREIAELKSSLFTKFKIETKGQIAVESELEGLKRQNENLRLTIGALQQKPGRAELRQLQLYDRAIHMMLANAPGFAPVWEDVLQRADRDVRDAEAGIGGFVRKVFVSQPGRKLPKEIALLPARGSDDREDEK